MVWLVGEFPDPGGCVGPTGRGSARVLGVVFFSAGLHGRGAEDGPMLNNKLTRQVPAHRQDRAEDWLNVTEAVSCFLTYTSQTRHKQAHAHRQERRG